MTWDVRKIKLAAALERIKEVAGELDPIRDARMFNSLGTADDALTSAITLCERNAVEPYVSSWCKHSSRNIHSFCDGCACACHQQNAATSPETASGKMAAAGERED